MLALKELVAPKVIDGAMLCGGHQPRTGIVRHAGFRPLLERGDQGILREFFGYADVAHDARKTGDYPGRFNPPDRIDSAMCEGRRHAYPSHHLQFIRASNCPVTRISGFLLLLWPKKPLLR